jgi:Fic family protein
MKWNWQQPDWPAFSWSRERLAKAEAQFLVDSGMARGAMLHLDGDGRDRLRVESMSEEAVTTSEIEGELLDRDSVRSSIRRQLGLATDNRRASPAELGIAEMMVDLHDNSMEPLDQETLFSWHALLMRGRPRMRNVGRYRTHGEPMQVVSGKVHDPTVHFEAPPSKEVPRQMATFLDWFNRTGPAGADGLPALTRSGIAHLHFESIHPFEDGNGRIGRAISEKALAQGLGGPTLTALAETILLRRREYYHMLESSNKHNDITEWLAWFAGMALEAQRRTRARVEFLIDKTKLLDRLRNQVNDRQMTVLLRMLREGPEGFRGALSAGNYMSIARTSPATATRDLADLVAKGALTRTGQRRHTRYHLTIPLRPVDRITIDAMGNLEVGRPIHARAHPPPS